MKEQHRGPECSRSQDATLGWLACDHISGFLPHFEGAATSRGTESHVDCSESIPLDVTADESIFAHMLLIESPSEMNEDRVRSDTAATSFRSPRRFACDRCRAYKARCERNGDLGVSCERCLKSQHTCTTNFDNIPPGMSFAIQKQQQQQQHHHWRRGSGASNNPTREIRPDTVSVQRQSPTTAEHGAAQVPFTSPRMPTGRNNRQIYPGEEPSLSRAILQNENLYSSAEAAAAAVDVYIASETSSRPLSSSQSTNEQTLVSSEDPKFDDSTTNVSSNNNNWLDSNYTGDLEEMDYSMAFSMPHLVFDKIDFAGLSDHHSTSRNGAGAARSAGLEDVSAMMRPGSNRSSNQANQNQNPANKRPNPPRSESESTSTSYAAGRVNTETQELTKKYRELLKLNLELMEDEEVLEQHKSMTNGDLRRDPQAAISAEDNLISRVLRRTSRFWDILSSIATIPETRQRIPSDGSFNGDASGPSRRQSWHRGGPDTLIIVHLITTYVSLIRICRSVFQHLYHVFQVIPPDQVGTVLNLPSLQLGEFQMENNLTIQVQALIELSCSMLLRIEEALGVSTASGPGLSGEGVSAKTLESHHCRNSIMRDPVAISLREIILSQERLHNAANEVGSPSLQVVMNNLKGLLQRR
ncbi:hypothetical protein FSARC_7183 [Fusarium sarcochroum]|uniref:Zn(2)-C6 fungal-type domain-containing protein n=1 Tax=Fusarium sarcochroum TaxID=1208366 RepID=A0A8H4TVN1_9HYPO|nr:hypothetical protein FSARC_7183 [Fusarium sarcochroum]